jgi:hypothetical protein
LDDRSTPRRALTGAKILGVAVDVGDESYLDLETKAAGAFARD